MLVESFLPIQGGLELHSFRLAEALITRGVRSFVLTRRIDPKSPARERIGHLEVIRFRPSGPLKGRGWKAPFLVAAAILQALTLLVRYERYYDIILVSGFKIFSLPALLTAWVFGKRCVIRIMSPIELRDDPPASELPPILSRLRMKLLNWLERVRTPLARRADQFVAISAQIEDRLRTIGIAPARIRAIPNGIDTERFRPASAEERQILRHRLGLPVAHTIVTYTGHLLWSKGLMNLIKVWPALSKQFPELHLVLVGSGSESIDSCETELKLFIRDHSLASTVTLTGKVDRVDEYLQASDLFVFPSDFEGFSNSTLEALACGLPAVLTRVGVAPELVQNERNGLLVPPHDSQALRQALTWLMDHRDRWNAIGMAARRSVQEGCNIVTSAEKYVEMFYELKGKPTLSAAMGGGEVLR
jgi:glycosyltransferase involved in cell wall biosynthesis